MMSASLPSELVCNTDVVNFGIFFDETEQLVKLGQTEAAEMKYTEFITRFDNMSGKAERNRFQYRMTEWLARAYNNRGLTRYKQVKFDDAHDDYTTAITLNPNFYQAYYNRGTIRYRLGDFAKAKQDFKQCVNVNPHFTEARNALKTMNET